MKQQVVGLSKWFYGGIWGVLTSVFRVPRDPPRLPVRPGEFCKSFQPAPGFLRYMKLQFFIIAAVVGLALLAAAVAVGVASVPAGVAVGLVLAGAMGSLTCLVYLAIHLRYDTTWYVVTDRSLRIRRGIWIIHETTITFENVQNVSVNQGPLQRLFGIANVLVETAGGGSQNNPQAGTHTLSSMQAHRGLIEGVADAQAIRDLLLKRLRESRSSGLGDDRGDDARDAGGGFTAEHIAALRDIRDDVRRLAAS